MNLKDFTGINRVKRLSASDYLAKKAKERERKINRRLIIANIGAAIIFIIAWILRG